MSKKELTTAEQEQLAFDLINSEVTFRTRKGGKEVTRKVRDFPLASILAFMQYGAGRFINDKTGGSDIDEKKAAELFDGIMDQLEKGWIDRRGTGGGGQTIDPVEREARNLAKGRVKDALKAKGVAMKDVPKEKMAEFIEQVLTKYGDELREKAKTIVKAQNTRLEIDDIDLDI